MPSPNFNIAFQSHYFTAHKSNMRLPFLNPTRFIFSLLIRTMLYIAKKNSLCHFYHSHDQTVCVSWYCFLVCVSSLLFMSRNTIDFIKYFSSLFCISHRFSSKTFPKAWILINKRVFVLPREIKEFRGFSGTIIPQSPLFVFVQTFILIRT